MCETLPPVIQFTKLSSFLEQEGCPPPQPETHVSILRVVSHVPIAVKMFCIASRIKATEISNQWQACTLPFSLLKGITWIFLHEESNVIH
jgi:hypothetical protein